MSMNQAAVVSVVTPFYNSDLYLGECIESVLGQTYGDFEYVLLNNCSTDRSADIAESYARKDPRIRLLHNVKHLTQKQNYNEALRHISSRSIYCKIVQADDALFPTCLEQMMALGRPHPSVGLISAYTQLGSSTVYLRGLPYPQPVFSGRDVCWRLLQDRLYVFGSPSSHMVRSDLVRQQDPFYNEDERTPVEDLEACFELLQHCDFGFVYQVLTFTRRDNESIMSRIKSFDPMILDEVIVVEKYGRLYLSEEEYRTCARAMRRRYLMFLGQSALRLRNRAFWQFHREGPASCGLKPNHWAVAGYAVLAFLSLLGNPLSTTWHLGAHLAREDVSLPKGGRPLGRVAVPASPRAECGAQRLGRRIAGAGARAGQGLVADGDGKELNCDVWMASPEAHSATEARVPGYRTVDGDGKEGRAGALDLAI